MKNHRSVLTTVFLLLLFLISTVAFASPSDQFHRPAGTNNSQSHFHKYKDGEILVKFKEGVVESSKANINKKNGSLKIQEFKSLRIQHLKIKKGLSVSDAISLYKNEPDVEYAEPNYLLSAQVQPNDPRFGELWGLEKINAPAAWDLATGDNSVVVAVIDTGADFTHPDLAGNIWVNPGEIAGNNVDDDGNGYVDDVYGLNVIAGGSPMDDNGHGTHVSGTIGAVGNNGIGVVGLNWDVNILACKFLDQNGFGSTDGAIQCLQYIKTLKDRGLNVVSTNNSWGGDAYSQALYDAINAQGDILFVAAAGNNSSDNDQVDFFPANYNLPSVIAVAATDADDNLASFSNYGVHSVHVGAPGQGVLSTLPSANYGALSGTSMATPHVTGLVALLKAQDPTRDSKALKNLVLAGGDDLAQQANGSITGKKINAVNSLNCYDSPVFSVLTRPVDITVGVPTTLSVLSINCGSPAGPVTVTASGGEPVTVADDGTAPDLSAGDGVFTGTWTPSQTWEALTFQSPTAEKIVEFPPLEITTTILPEGSIDAYYSGYLLAEGGMPSYSWAITSGSLPPGLNMDSAGEIAGSPTENGVFTFTAQVTDSIGATAQKNMSISVLNDFVLQAWMSEYLTTTNQFGTPEGDIATDNSGNSYVTGNYYGFWHMPASVWVTKYDSDGNVVWQRDDIGGNIAGTYKALDSIAVDSAGNVYGAGYVNNKVSDTLPPDSWLTVKYAPSGNVLWDRSYAAGIDGAAKAVAVDGNGNVYVTGYGGRGVNSYTGVNESFIITAKYDASGNLQWASNYGEDNSKQGYGIAVDQSGNSYVVGSEYIISNGSSWFDIAVLKYDPSGNLLWSKQFYPPADYNYHGRAIALDENGNIYIEGTAEQKSTFFDNYYLTIKCDASGNQLWSNTYHVDRGEARDIAVDRNGNSYVTGDFFVNGDPNGVRSISTLKYDSAGTLVGAKNYSNPSYLKTWAKGIALDSNDDLVLAGFSYNNDINVNFFVMKYTQLPLVPLQLDMLGAGSGTVSVVPGTDCTDDCSQYFKIGTQLTLTAAADTNSVFSGWGGNDCTGTGICTVTMDGIKQITATFTLNDLVPPTTTASPSGGTYASPQSVTLTANEPATIYYSTDGSTPTTTSSIYSSPITIPGNTTLKFFAKDLAGNREAVQTETYLIDNPLDFMPRVNYSTGYYPVAVAAGDFNGDGDADMVSANQNANSVSILLGNGDGTFQSKVDYAVGTRPNSVVTADFNSDAKDDLAVVNIDTNNLSILSGNGDGTFLAKVDVALGSGPSSVVAGDFNSDGKTDLAVSYYSIGSVSILVGNGDGTFQPMVDYPVGAQPQSLVMGDFNNDGRPDLAAANYASNTVSILQGNGDGTFQAKVDYGAGTYPAWVETGDFNQDGKLDLAVANWTNNAVSILLGNGDSTFSLKASYAVENRPLTIIAKDYNNNGTTDLMVVNTSQSSNNVSVLIGNGDGSFQPKIGYNAVAYSRGATSEDFNGDGKFDLAVTNPAQNNISVLLNNSQTVVPSLTVSLSSSPASPQYIGAAVTFSAAAAGGSGSYEYQFWFRAVGASSYSLAQDYSASDVYLWDTALVAEGDYEWIVYARNAGSAAQYEAVSQVVTYTLALPPAASVTLSASPASPQYIGAAVTFSAAAAGGSGSYECQFWFRAVGASSYSLAQDYSASDVYLWDTALVAEGDYEWIVYARNAGSAAQYEAVSEVMTYTVNPPPVAPVKSVNISADPRKQQEVGNPVTLSAKARGGVAPYQYRFVIKDSGGNTVVDTGYGPANKYVWNTTGFAAGTYTAEVQARSAGNIGDAEASSSLAYQLVNPLVSSVSLTSSLPSPQSLGGTVTFSGQAFGGTAPCQYQFIVKKKGKVVVSSGYSTSNTWTWSTASNLAAGTLCGGSRCS